METWVLVLIVSSQMGGSVATVPGYSSQRECSQAGAAINSMTGGRIAGDGSQLLTIKWLCSPGPTSEVHNLKK
jgi:hypothetical protein